MSHNLDPLPLQRDVIFEWPQVLSKSCYLVTNKSSIVIMKHHKTKSARPSKNDILQTPGNIKKDDIRKKVNFLYSSYPKLSITEVFKLPHRPKHFHVVKEFHTKINNQYFSNMEIKLQHQLKMPINILWEYPYTLAQQRTKGQPVHAICGGFRHVLHDPRSRCPIQ